MPRRYQKPANECVPMPFREAGMTYRQMDYWVRRGHLRPITKGEGPGYHRSWPQEEIEVGCRMAVLVNDGYKLSAAARLARQGEHPMTA